MYQLDELQSLLGDRGWATRLEATRSFIFGAALLAEGRQPHGPDASHDIRFDRRLAKAGQRRHDVDLMQAGPVLRTERLILRRWRDSDREPFAAMNSDPAVMEHFPALMSAAESDAFVDYIEETFGAHGFGLWAVEVAGAADFVGFVGLNPVGFEAHFTPAVEVGWRLPRSAWGHGYATEAGRVALQHGFGRLGLREIVSFTSTMNVRSQRVMMRLGMTHDSADDFDHPRLIRDDRLRRHVLYRITPAQSTGSTTANIPT